MNFPTWLRLCCRTSVLLFVIMMIYWFVCHCDATNIAPSGVDNNTRSLIGYINGSIEIECDVNASDSFSWTKDGKELQLGERIVTSRDGRLIFRTLHKNDSGNYTCIDGLNGTRGKNITLIVLDKTRLPVVVGVIASPAQLPVSSYTLPEWMTSVACVVVIALVTIIIIISYVRVSKPKRDLSNHSNVEMSDITEESIEVVTVKKNAEKSHDEGYKTSNHGKVRQRKSSSSPTHDSCSIENECLEGKSASKKKRKEKEKEDERKGRLCTVEYVKEIPEKLELSEGNKRGLSLKVNSESRRNSEKGFAASEVRCSLEKITRREEEGPDDKKSKLEQERKLAGPGNSKKELNSAYLSTKHPPKKYEAEPLNRIESKPGQALRKIISDPCLMNRPPFLVAHTRIDDIGHDNEPGQGQALRRISSEPIHTATIHSEPIVKGSLKLDKKSLKELKLKIQKSAKSPIEIQRQKFDSKKKNNKNKKFSPAAISFTNEIYGSVEELRAPEDEPKVTVVSEESEIEPIYAEIQEKRDNNVVEDEKCEGKKAERKEVRDSLQDIKGKSSNRKNISKKGGPKVSKSEYEPRKLNFGALPEDEVRLQQCSSPAKVEESHENQEKCFENLSFSILEDLEEFDEDFDEEPNKVVDGIYQDVEGQPSNLAETLNQTTESLYEEIHFSCTATCQDQYEEVNELA